MDCKTSLADALKEAQEQLDREKILSNVLLTEPVSKRNASPVETAESTGEHERLMAEGDKREKVIQKIIKLILDEMEEEGMGNLTSYYGIRLLQGAINTIEATMNICPLRHSLA